MQVDRSKKVIRLKSDSGFHKEVFRSVVEASDLLQCQCNDIPEPKKLAEEQMSRSLTESNNGDI